MYVLSILTTAAISAAAAVAPSSTASSYGPTVSPQVLNVTLVANVTDPSVSRDSCAAVKFTHRALWVCRDTEAFKNGMHQLPLITNSASWTNFSNGQPRITQNGAVGAASNGSNPILEMYGGNPISLPAFYPVLPDQCAENGVCKDSTRWAVWPASPPMVTYRGNDGSIKAYTWVRNQHIENLTLLDTDPSCTLYKLSFTPSGNINKLPDVSIVNGNFWSSGEIDFGVYGNIVYGGYAYLYGQLNAQHSSTALARVPKQNLEDKSQYEYYIDGAWTKNQPVVNQSNAMILNAGAGGQGTFYYSTYFDSFIWIGQANISAKADFYITTAPWLKPWQFYTGESGDAPIAGYSLQAQPALLTSLGQNGIYLTWTQGWKPTTYGAYVTPLVYVTWKPYDKST